VHGFGFHTLALLTVIGLAGPLLASLPRLRVPVVVGELIAGLVVGRTGFDVVDVTNPTFELFADIGFALVMFVVGTHVPVRAAPIRSAISAALAVAGCAAVFFVVLRAIDLRGWRRRVHVYSEKRRFALELRTNLIVLFALAALALSAHVSIMLAGFAVGLVVSVVGEPRRLARQLFGITEGFFSPLFFVWLGASLQVRELGAHPKLILLGVGLGLGAVLAHCAGRLFGQPLPFAVLSSAQLGVPVAAATIGTQQHLLAAGESAALIFGALLTIAATSIAGVVASRNQATAEADKPAANGTHAV